jgi:hypothetical protein
MAMLPPEIKLKSPVADKLVVALLTIKLPAVLLPISVLVA